MSEQIDPRRQRPIEIIWYEGRLTGQLRIDGVLWGAVEWSDKRKAWCIEDAEGRCLSHHSHIHAQDTDKAGAFALAEAMIRDGRMPTPEEATVARKARLKRDRERRAKQPSQIKRQQEKAEHDRLWKAKWDAERLEQSAERDAPLWEMLADVYDLADPELWKSNSFARLRERLIIHLRAAIAELEMHASGEYRGIRLSDSRAKDKLARTRDILAVLEAGGKTKAKTT